MRRIRVTIDPEICRQALPEEGFKAQIEIVGRIQTLGIEKIVSIPLKVRNVGTHTWPADGICGVKLSYHWLDKQGKSVVFDGERTDLTHDLERSEWIVLDSIVRTPSFPGDYLLEFDLIQEHVAWFKDRGSETVVMPVNVIDCPMIWPNETMSIIDDLIGSIDRIRFNMEGESLLEVSGWVASRSRGLAENAAVYLDSTLLGNVSIGQPRNDIASLTSPDLLSTGWTGRFRYLTLEPGYHLVELFACAGLERGVVPLAGHVISVTEDGTVRTVGQDFPGSLPIPSPDMIKLVTGTTNVDWFLRSGAMGAWTLERTLSMAMKRIEDLDFILDFGCGCGRLIRHLQRHSKPHLHGSDCNPVLIDYCRTNLGFAEFETNLAWPPLPYGDEKFDFIYAFSVLTHMTLPQQRAWMRELSRVLRKGGLFIITTHGSRYRRVLYGEDRRRFDEGSIVIHRPDVAGTNECMAYHPPESLPTILPENITFVCLVPEGAKGNPYQDLYLLMKT